MNFIEHIAVEWKLFTPRNGEESFSIQKRSRRMDRVEIEVHRMDLGICFQEMREIASGAATNFQNHF